MPNDQEDEQLAAQQTTQEMLARITHLEKEVKQKNRLSTTDLAEVFKQATKPERTRINVVIPATRGEHDEHDVSLFAEGPKLADDVVAFVKKAQIPPISHFFTEAQRSAMSRYRQIFHPLEEYKKEIRAARNKLQIYYDLDRVMEPMTMMTIHHSVEVVVDL